jgi:hypothetical protein
VRLVDRCSARLDGASSLDQQHPQMFALPSARWRAQAAAREQTSRQGCVDEIVF